VVNAASYLGGAVSPGEIVVIFGSDLGPSTGVSAQPSSSGIFGATLANVQVTFNGYPAPLLYASAEQVNAIVPYELAGASSALVEVLFGQASSNSVTMPVALSAPGIFSANASGTGPGAILDTNYNLVSTSNPTSPGSIVQIYATGEGQTTPPGVDGKARRADAAAALSQPTRIGADWWAAGQYPLYRRRAWPGGRSAAGKRANSARCTFRNAFRSPDHWCH
jgi:uncharacterized protein (TIGR03437 family)